MEILNGIGVKRNSLDRLNSKPRQPLGTPSPPGLWPGEQGAGGLRGPTARKAVWF
jgi:hypothetical protein